MQETTIHPLPARPLVLTMGQVAHLLGMGEVTFRNRRAALERDCGFPAKLPGIGKYSLPAVTRWVETNGVTHEPAAPDATLQREISDLEKTYGQQVAA